MNTALVNETGIQALSADEIRLVGGGTAWGAYDPNTSFSDAWFAEVMDWYFTSYQGNGTLMFVEHTGYDSAGNAFTYVQPAIFGDTNYHQDALQVDSETEHETSYASYSSGYDPGYYNGDYWQYDGGGDSGEYVYDQQLQAY